MKLQKKIFVALLLLIFFSCQQEELILVENVSDSNLSSDDPLTKLFLQITQNPTGFDNILDNSSCFRTRLPVTIVVNGQNLTISTAANFSQITNIQNNFPGNDVVNLVFPIVIEFQNYEKQNIANLAQLNAVRNNCSVRNNGFDELACIRFNFPLSLRVFDSNVRQNNVQVFANNTNLFNFIDNLSSTTIYELRFPVSMTDSNNQTVVFNSNKALEKFIEDQIDDCTGVPSGVLNPNLIGTLTSGTWRISYFKDDDDDQTNEFVNYRFVFNSNNSVTVSKNGVLTLGTWNVFLEAGITKIKLTFVDDDLSDIDSVWRLLQFNSNNINLRDPDNDDDATYLNFTKI